MAVSLAAVPILDEIVGNFHHMVDLCTREEPTDNVYDFQVEREAAKLLFIKSINKIVAAILFVAFVDRYFQATTLLFKFLVVAGGMQSSSGKLGLGYLSLREGIELIASGLINHQLIGIPLAMLGLAAFTYTDTNLPSLTFDRVNMFVSHKILFAVNYGLDFTAKSPLLQAAKKACDLLFCKGFGFRVTIGAFGDSK